jgi:hypothetical protein
MKPIIILIVAGVVCIFAVLLFGQTVPSPDEAKTTCITLVRLLNIAQQQHKAADSAALSQAYKIVRGYAGSSDLGVDDTAVATFDHSNPQLADFYTPRHKNGGGYNNHTIDELSALDAADEHKAAIIVIDKNHNIERFHSDMDAATVNNMLTNVQGMHAVSGHTK